MSISNPILPNEKELFARMAGGDEAAFADIFFHYIPVLQPHIFRMTRSEEVMQDIIHETFLSIWVNRVKMLAVENHRAYIFTMSTNKTYNWMKKMAQERLAIAGAKSKTNDYSNDTEEMVDFNESAEFINQAVALLPPQKKLIFKLSREEGLSHEEIAERLNISKNTVSNHLTQSLLFIKDYLLKMPGGSLILLGFMLEKVSAITHF